MLQMRTGRWIERDPECGVPENPMSLNRYVYCYNNPLSYTDPDGTVPKVINTSENRYWITLTSMAFGIYYLLSTKAAFFFSGTYGTYEGVALRRNFIAETNCENGVYSIQIWAKADTLGQGIYQAAIRIDADDTGSYNGEVINDSTTLVSVDIYHMGSGTLDLELYGAGPIELNVMGSGNVTITLSEKCTGDVTVNIISRGIVTIRVPRGQSPPQITGLENYIIEYYDPEEDDKNES
jgi:hypothetical protein